jgi:hypothetical protein
MTSKATRKRRRKKRNITMPGGETRDPPQRQGERNDLKPREDPMGTVIEARRRFMGNMADKVDLRSAMAGDDLGRAILRADLVRRPDGKPDATYNPGALWDAVSHMRRTVAAYDRACGAPSRHPKCLGILTPPDRLEATAESPAFDDRPQAERDRAAVAAYMSLQGWLGHCDARARSACLRAAVDDAGVSDLPGIVAALQCVVDGKAGRKIVWRGRADR